MAAGSHKAVSSCWFSQDTIHSQHIPPTPPAVAEVKLFITVPARSPQMAPPKEQQSVAGFRGRRDAAVPVWLRKQLWGLICPTPPQRRGCNSIASWPTVLLLAGSAAQALLKKSPAEEMSQRAPRRAKGMRAVQLPECLSSPRPPSKHIQFHSAIYHRGHISCRGKCREKDGGKVISGWFAVEQNQMRHGVM